MGRTHDHTHHNQGKHMKEFYGRWKYSKKRGAWIWKWKKRKVNP